MSIIKKEAFMILPFGGENQKYSKEYWDDKFEYFFKPFFENQLDLVLTRSKALPGDLVDGIIVKLMNSDIVIADITDYNPNVLWELGVRHSFKTGTVIIAEYGTVVPFDLGKIGIIFYPLDSNLTNPKTQKFLKDLKSAVTRILNNPKHPDSPVIVGNTGRGTIFALIFKDELLRKTNALLVELKFNRINIGAILKTAKKNKKEIDNLSKDLEEFDKEFSELEKKGSKNTKEIKKMQELRKKTDSLREIFDEKKEESGVTLSNRMIVSSIESLVTDRYLDENHDFYLQCLNYYEYLIEMNDTLGSWHFKKRVMETWLIKNVPEMLKQNTKIRKLILNSQKKLNLIK